MSAETFHKGEKRKGYTIQFKQNVARYPNENLNRSAASRFKGNEKIIREWKKQIEKLTATDPDVDLEESLLACIYDCRSNALPVSIKMIMFKANFIHDEMNPESSKTSCICFK